MDLQNGYKVIYEKAADGKRTFYASKLETGKCDTTVDTELASFTDSDYKGKVIYEYKGSFYISEGKTPAYDEDGVPTDERLSAFDEVFVKAEPTAVASEEDLPEDTNEVPETGSDSNPVPEDEREPAEPEE